MAYIGVRLRGYCSPYISEPTVLSVIISCTGEYDDYPSAVYVLSTLLGARINFDRFDGTSDICTFIRLQYKLPDDTGIKRIP
jgi:hypothetical protein